MYTQQNEFGAGSKCAITVHVAAILTGQDWVILVAYANFATFQQVIKLMHTTGKGNMQLVCLTELIMTTA